MIQQYRILRDAARRVAAAAQATVEVLRDGRIEQEPAFTDRMLGRIEQVMDGYSHRGVTWRAKTLTDRAHNSQEHRFGADFFGVLEIRLDAYVVNKGFLAQAKLIRAAAYTRQRETDKLREQCEKMLRLSPAAFVFLYSTNGIRIVPAIAVVSSTWTDLAELYSRSVSKFYEEHFSCFIGDPRINLPHESNLASLAEEYQARNGLQLIAAEEPEGFLV